MTHYMGLSKYVEQYEDWLMASDIFKEFFWNNPSISRLIGATQNSTLLCADYYVTLMLELFQTLRYDQNPVHISIVI